jgi:hypothetical protein
MRCAKHLTVCLLLAFSAVRLNASEWYEDVAFTQSDPFQFDKQRIVLFPHSGLTLGGHPATGKLYAILPPSTVSQLDNDSKHCITLASHALTADEARSYKTIFTSVASSSQIPWIVGAIGSLPTPVTSLVGVVSTLIDGLYRLTDSKQKVSSSALAELMAQGGRFDLVLILIKDPHNLAHRYVSSTVTYSTTVGAEARTYAITSSTFALKE